MRFVGGLDRVLFVLSIFFVVLLGRRVFDGGVGLERSLILYMKSIKPFAICCEGHDFKAALFAIFFAR